MISTLPPFALSKKMLLPLMVFSFIAFTAVAQPSNHSSNVLIVGGGNHHDFDRWFDEEDRKIISEIGASVAYTDDPNEILPQLSGLDILYLSNNQPMPATEEFRNSIFDFVESGNGLLLVHPSIWYNWEDWPEYNRELVGGGSRSHPPYGEFDVSVIDPDHPVMEGVPDQFTIKDELYRFEKDSEGVNIHVLATGLEEETGTEHPVVWTAGYGQGRIVGITLGHDGEAHQHPAYIRLLQNSIKWLAETE